MTRDTARAPAPGAASPDASSYTAQIEEWRSRRVAALTAPDGWLSVVGLFWLEEGDNTVGSAPGSRVALPARTPPRAGVIGLEGGRAVLRAAPGAGVTVDGRAAETEETLRSDDDAGEKGPTVVSIGSVQFYLISRQGRLAARVKDPDSAARSRFHGLTYFPIDPSWRIEARFEENASPTTVAVPNVLGAETSERSPGTIVFERAGKTHRLTPVLEQGETDYFVIFGDATNGHDTYGAGRFLYVAPPKDGRTVIDFNKAYNPPCVFTDYATCPLPPPGNRLPIRVEAGERSYAHEEPGKP